MSKITVDLGEIKFIADEAGKLVLNKEIDVELKKLLDLRDTIEAEIDRAEANIEQAGLAFNPIFKSVGGDFVKASYRAFGQKFYLDETKLDQIATDFYTKEVTTKYKPNTDVIEKWAENAGVLPEGIIQPPRPKKLSLGLKKTNEPSTEN